MSNDSYAWIFIMIFNKKIIMDNYLKDFWLYKGNLRIFLENINVIKN